MSEKLRTLAQRKAARKEIRSRVLANAEAEIAKLGRTVVCQDGHHDGCGYGRRWSVDCLCECHDPSAPA